MRQNTDLGALAKRLINRQVSIYKVLIVVALIVAVVIPFVIHNTFYIRIFIMVFLMGYLGTAWGFVGQTGQVSFGHAAYLGLGAYTSTILFRQLGVTPWLGMFAGALVATIAGLVIGYPTLRLRGPYFALATLAFAYILQVFLVNIRTLGPVYLGGTPGLGIPLQNMGNSPAVFQFMSQRPYYFIALGMLVGIVSLNYLLNRIRIGYYWSAIRGNQDAAESLGINAGGYRLIAFLISCALSAFGGTFYAQYISYIDPMRVVDISISIEIVLVGIVGGWQTVFGPMIGAFIVIPISYLMRARLGGTFPGLYLIIYGSILMLFILLLSKGIIGPFMRGLKYLENRVWRPQVAANDNEVEGI